MFEDTILRSTYRDHGDTCGNAQLSTRLRLWLGRLAMSAGVLLTLSVQVMRTHQYSCLGSDGLDLVESTISTQCCCHPSGDHIVHELRVYSVYSLLAFENYLLL